MKMLVIKILPILLILVLNTNTKIMKKSNADVWSGKWFPFGSRDQITVKPRIPTSCDDGLRSIAIDFDPKNKTQNFKFLCFNNKNDYLPNQNIEAVLVEHFIPPFYVPPVRCMNESIEYEEKLPTFGPFRPMPPKYGAYSYLPPQRWMRSLAEGAIVMIYHPCAFDGQVQNLIKILTGCLYRHIITPSQALSKERPMALLAWGKCLQMSVVDDRIVAEFIQGNARRGPLSKIRWNENQKNAYTAGLSSESHLITDLDDSELCGFLDIK